jgi:hypothetical protein
MTTCPACSYPFLGDCCDNPGCEASGNVPPAILTWRRREAAEAAERERMYRIRAAMNSMPESYWGD